MKRFFLLTLIVLAIGSSSFAQSFGIGFGYFGSATSNGVGINVPLEFGITQFGDVNLSVRAELGVVFSQKPDLNVVFSPIISYTVASLGVLPIKIYAGPTIQLFVQNVLEGARSFTWSLLGGLTGVSVLMFGLEPVRRGQPEFHRGKSRVRCAVRSAVVNGDARDQW